MMAINLSQFSDKVRLSPEHQRTLVPVESTRRSLPYSPALDSFVGALLSGEEYQNPTLAELGFLQLIKFVLFDQDRLSSFIDFDVVLPDLPVPARPEEVSVVLTKRCNLSCLHCYNDSGSAHPHEMSSAQKLSLIEFLCRWGITRLTLTGGEPTLDPTFPKALELADKFGVGVKVSTNAWSIAPALLNAIRRRTVQQLNISLDGADDDTHDFYRQQHGSFARVIKALEVVSATNLRILVLNVAVHPRSLAQMKAIADIAVKYGATAVSFKPITRTGRDVVGNETVLSDCQIADFRAERDRLRKQFAARVEIDGKLIEESIPTDLRESVVCNAGQLAMFIDADGRMLPCETVDFVTDAPMYGEWTPMEAWWWHPTFAWFREIRLRSSGGCGTAGCPGSIARVGKLVQLAGLKQPA